MTPSELITRVNAFTDNVPSTDGDYSDRRRRHLDWLQEVEDDVWHSYDYSWKRGRATVTVATGDYDAALPDDFGNIPAEGGVFDGSYRYEDVSQFFTASGREGADIPPTYTYSIYNVGDGQRIQFPSVGPRTLTIYYNRRPPQLSDKMQAPTAIESGGGNVNGTVRYLVVPFTEDGLEQEPGSSLTFVASNDQVMVTLPDPGPEGEHNVYRFDVYRTLAGGTTAYYKLNGVTDLLFGIDTTFIDNNLDASILAQPLVFAPLVAKNQLDQIPVQYHRTVLLPGVISKARRSKGDTRDWPADYQKGLKDMIKHERQRKSAIQQVPRAITGGW